MDVVTTNDDGCQNSLVYYVSIIRQMRGVTEEYPFDKGKVIVWQLLLYIFRLVSLIRPSLATHVFETLFHQPIVGSPIGSPDVLEGKSGCG